MSFISYVTLSITRTSLPEGHICRIDYSYYLDTDRFAYLSNESFSVGCELYGHHLAHDEDIGEHVYDVHTVSSHDPMPVTRSFLVPCEVLNEKIGRDSIYIRVFVNGSNGERFAALSPVIKDWF